MEYRKIWIAVFTFLVTLSLQAHKLESGQAVLTLSQDGVWILELELNLTRYIQSNPDLADSVRPQFRILETSRELNDDNFNTWETVFLQCEAQFREELKVLEEGEEIQSFEIWFPHPSELEEEVFKSMQAEGLHIKAFASGKLTSEANALQLRFPLDIGEVILTTLRPEVQWVVTGELSSPVYLSGGGSPGERDEFERPSIFRYVRIGFVHIVPYGLDHILFVLGLFLLAARLRPLLIQITAFTIAHTLTLGLSIYGVISLPSGVVEPLIALSIALVAFENIITDKIHAWRPVVVFLFGLLHGLGFAGVLGEIGLPHDEFLTALLFFNCGVELGQLTVVLTSLILLGSFRKKSWYRSHLTKPLSFLIGLIGLFWTVQRLLS